MLTRMANNFFPFNDIKCWQEYGETRAQRDDWWEFKML